MRLPAHATHDAIRIKGQVADRVDPFFFGLEILAHRRAVRPGERRVTHQLEVRFRPAGDDGHAGRDPIAAFRLDIAQDGFAFETVQAFAQ